MGICDCQFRTDGECKIASQQSGLPCTIADDACGECCKTDTPDSGVPNHVTTSIALLAVQRAAPADFFSLYQKYGNLLKPIVPPAHELLEVLPCVHRGNQLMSVKCELCGGRERWEPLFSCGVFDECVLRRYKAGRGGAKSCLTCESRVPPERKP